MDALSSCHKPAQPRAHLKGGTRKSEEIDTKRPGRDTKRPGRTDIDQSRNLRLTAPCHEEEHASQNR